MSQISQQLIDNIETSILSNKLMPKDSDNLPTISFRDYEEAKIGWNIMKEAYKNDYFLFASNSQGMTSYGFYKANNGDIYIIEAFVGEIQKIYIPSKKWDCLKNLIKD
jgi:hypothetical protein